MVRKSKYHVSNNLKQRDLFCNIFPPSTSPVIVMHIVDLLHLPHRCNEPLKPYYKLPSDQFIIHYKINLTRIISLMIF